MIQCMSSLHNSTVNSFILKNIKVCDWVSPSVSHVFLSLNFVGVMLDAPSE